MKKYLPWFFAALIFVGFSAISLSISQENIRTFIQQFGPLAPAVFILLTLISNIIAPLSGMPALFAGHVLFGQQVIIYAIIAAIISYITNFWIARIWGRVLVTKLVGHKNIEKIDKFTKDYGVISLFTFRIFLGYVHDLVSYAAGFTSMKFSTYITVSLLAAVPGTLLWYYLSRFANNSISFMLLTYSIGLVFLIIYLLAKKSWKNFRKLA